MRPVLFKRWIPKIEKEKWEISNYPFPTPAYEENTNCWEADFIHKGLFHQWASMYEESSEGFVNYTVGLIELEDGTMEQVLPSNIKFVDKLDLN